MSVWQEHIGSSSNFCLLEFSFVAKKYLLQGNTDAKILLLQVGSLVICLEWWLFLYACVWTCKRENYDRSWFLSDIKWNNLLKKKKMFVLEHPFLFQLLYWPQTISHWLKATSNGLKEDSPRTLVTPAAQGNFPLVKKKGRFPSGNGRKSTSPSSEERSAIKGR